MTVRELKDISDTTRIIALDSKDGKKLFDTRSNRKEYVDRYTNAKICQLWSSVIDCHNGFVETAIVMYLSHNSWLESEAIENECK